MYIALKTCDGNQSNLSLNQCTGNSHTESDVSQPVYNVNKYSKVLTIFAVTLNCK